VQTAGCDGNGARRQCLTTHWAHWSAVVIVRNGRRPTVVMFMTGWDGSVVPTQAPRFLCGESEVEQQRRDKGAGDSASVHRYYVKRLRRIVEAEPPTAASPADACSARRTHSAIAGSPDQP
jgi:hypothetical protein